MKYLILFLCLVIAIGAWIFAPWSQGSRAETKDSLLHVIKKETIRICTVENGQLQAVKSHAVTAERGKIEWVIKEGAEVKEGEKILELDANQYKEQIKKNESELNSRKEDLIFLKSSLSTEENIAQSWIEDARLKHDSAGEALRKFMQIDSFNNMNKHDRTIEDTEQKLTQALAELERKQNDLDESVFVENNLRENMEKEFNAADKNVDGLRKQLEAAENERSLYKSRTYPKELKQLKRELERAELEVEKERGRSRQSLINYKSKIDNAAEEIIRYEEAIVHANKSLEKCIVTAPVSGVVIYGDPKAGNQHWISQNLKAGGQSYANYTLMTIPDMTQFSVQVPISEHARGRIAVGCKAEIEIPAIPGLMVQGLLTSISQLATPRQPGNPSSPKVYTGTVELSGHDSRMVSGMTARVTLIGEILDNALAIPVESVFANEGAYFCWVALNGRAERRTITLGKTNVFLVEVLSGLTEGESVYVVEPADQDHDAAQ